MGIVEQYLLQLNTEKQRFRRVTAIVTALSLLVVSIVSWNLRLTGITLANDASCGQAEYQHTEACPVKKVLICGYPEEADAVVATQPAAQKIVKPTEAPTEVPTEAPTETPTEEVIIIEESLVPGAETPFEETPTEHIHTEACYQITYLCGYEEHIHVISCYSDLSSDIESASVWEATLPPLTGQWATDVARVAQSQIGCSESERNYLVADDGQTRNGITRYGQWYGNPYADWPSIFVMFCLNYAGIPAGAVPRSASVHNMMRLAEDAAIVYLPDDSAAAVGNILFLDTDGNRKADRSLIVTASSGGSLTAVGGDWGDAVCEVSLSCSDSRMLGYIHVAQVQEGKTVEQAQTPVETVPPETAEPTELPAATEPEESTDATEADGQVLEPSDTPEITLHMELLEDKETLRITAQTANIDESVFMWQWQSSKDGNNPWTDIEGAEGLIYEFAATEENAVRYYRLQGRKAEQLRSTFALKNVGITTDDEAGIITSEAVTPFSINKNNNVYTIDVYALPVDSAGNRIPGIALTDIGSFTVSDSTKIDVSSKFETNLGTYQSAYFGTENSVEVDHIAYVWRNTTGQWFWATHYLAYQQVGGTSNDQWLVNSDSAVSLYLRYIPNFTVSFESEGYAALTETVPYGGHPTLTEPGTWTREGYTLAGWTVNGNEQNVYTYEEILKLPVRADVSYTAKWHNRVTVSFNLGENSHLLYPVDPIKTAYGSSIPLLPTPAWRNNEDTMAFDGWYLDEDLTEQATADYVFYADTTLYAKWAPRDDGFYVYFMDFYREGQVPLVLMTYSVTEGQTISPYTPGNVPEGTQWDGQWYLDEACTNAYDFSIPVSQMTENLAGVNGRDLYLYPGTQSVCRAIFVTYGTKIDPVTVGVGEAINLDRYVPQRPGYEFAGWILGDGTPVSGQQVLNQSTTYYATWESGYVPFEAILRIENANDTGLTQADILGTWYAKSGSQIRVNSTYTSEGDDREGTHEVVCVLDGQEYPVYTNAALSRQATLSDVYETYYIYNNSGTNWTDEVNWDDVYTGGELPYSTRPVSSAGDTIINFDYMRVRNDIVFTIPNGSAYLDVFKLYQSGLITGSVTYTDTKPSAAGSNFSATGVSGSNVSWSYSAANTSNGNNLYTLHDMKYGQRIYEVYPVGSSWLSTRDTDFHQYRSGSGQLFSSRREDLSPAFFSGSGRQVTPYSLTAEFKNQERIALMYAMECLAGETADFTINGKGYKVQTQLCEVVRHTGDFGIKELLGCKEGVNPLENQNRKYYSNLNSSTATLGGTSVKTLFGTTYWDYYKTYVSNLSNINRAYIFYYDRLYMSIQFNFAYDSDGDGSNETVAYENIAYGEKIAEYQFGAPDFANHKLLNREGYQFAGWLDPNGYVLEAEDWDSLVVSGDSEDSSMIFVAKWEKISNNIVEYYEDVSAEAAFETHYFDDGALLEYPTMSVYPQGWVWQEYGEGPHARFDWDVPMYGEYGVQEVRQVNGEDVVVNVIRIYGTWDETHTKVVYDPNAAQGGIPGTTPVDTNEYTIWQSKVPVMSQGSTANVDPDAIFVGWMLDRNGIVYQGGDHVPVHWPRTMIFTAQWATAEEIVYLRYDPNGGIPERYYPGESGFGYKKDATALVWNNTASDGSVWYHRTGYAFTGWNTQADGSGTAYNPGANIVLTEPMTTLYAQWQKDTHSFSVHKVDRTNQHALPGAVFELYRYESGEFLLQETLTTGSDGRADFAEIATGEFYKLVEAKPPGGYAIITKEIYFRLAPGIGSVSLEFCDSEGNVISAPSGISGEYISGMQHLMLTAENVAGFELPATGGIGTPLYILGGVILMFTPFVYGFRLRRRYERRPEK